MARTILPWIGLFVLVNCGFHLAGGTNPASRFSLMAALTEDGTYRINAYRHVSIDWAQTPDGNTYSNKAPGPALLGWPVFWLVDAYLTRGMETRAERNAYRIEHKARYLKVLSWLFQVFPFAFLLWWTAVTLRERDVSSAGIVVSVLALAFGHTASLLMNTYFGHGMAALWVLGATLALLRKNSLWLGWCLGWALLSDYSVALLFPGFAFAYVRTQKASPRLLAGALLPAALWIHYHVSCFGSPFILPNAYQNPVFQDTLQSSWNLWGVFQVPPAGVFLELLWGAERGILWTQPWVLVLLVVGNYRQRELPFLCLSGLALLLVMNAAFGAWWGGLTPGPRYLSAVFPIFGVWLGLSWNGFSPWQRNAVLGALGVSLCFYVLVVTTHISPPPERALWPLYLEAALWKPTATTLLRLGILVALTAGAIGWVRGGRRAHG